MSNRKYRTSKQWNRMSSSDNVLVKRELKLRWKKVEILLKIGKDRVSSRLSPFSAGGEEGSLEGHKNPRPLRWKTSSINLRRVKLTRLWAWFLRCARGPNSAHSHEFLVRIIVLFFIGDDVKINRKECARPAVFQNSTYRRHEKKEEESKRIYASI